MKAVTASAPGKLMLFGEHSVVHGHPCIVTAVDQHLFVTVKQNGNDVFSLEAPDLGLKIYSKTIADLGKKPPKSVRFVETLYKRFLEKYPQKKGVHVITKSDFSSSFGFGSSSAVTVAFAKALTTLYGFNLSKKELFDLCYQAVLEVQGVGSGFDLAAAIWGGTIYYVPPADKVETIQIKNLPLLVGYTGVKADTPTLIRMVANLKDKNPVKIGEVFEEIDRIVEQAKKVLASNDIKKLGDLMKANQTLLRKLEVSSLELEKLIRAAEKAGATGAKLSGAGGGDCMIAVAEESKIEKVAASLKNAGGKLIKVNLDVEGVRLEN
ncbi:MAG: mevalonate kinase [Candidatus Woesebacteria bacterium]|jgi:mevalonate kinase